MICKEAFDKHFKKTDFSIDGNPLLEAGFKAQAYEGFEAGWNAKPFDPWTNAPRDKGKYILRIIYYKWWIYDEGHFHDYASGYAYPPLDPARDGETRTWSGETWENA